MVRFSVFIYISFLFVCLLPIYLTRKLDVLYQWKSVDFTYLTNEARTNDLNNGNFVPDNCIIIDVDVWQPEPEIGGKIIIHPDSQNNKNKRRIFVTLPRFKSGIPVTFAEVSDKKRGSTALLSPFPNWEAHRNRNCDGLTSVYRTMIDTCGRLWVLDSGVINNFGPESVRQCPPKVVAYDLKNNDRIVERYEFPREVLADNSLLITIAVDTRGNNCRDTFVYVADVVEYKLIVYDVNNGVSWRVNSDLFYPYPLEGRFNIAGTRFHLMDGLFGLALSPLRSKTRTLYFHSLASLSEGWIDTSIIRNRSLLQNNEDAAFYMFSSSRSVRPSQSAAEAMTENGILIFSLLSEIAIACHNIQTPYTKENLHMLEQDSNTLQFPSGMKVVKNQLWVMTSEFQNYIAETAKADDVKYRILTGSIDQLLYSSGCNNRFNQNHPTRKSTMRIIKERISGNSDKPIWLKIPAV